jgi:hypothetical protein
MITITMTTHTTQNSAHILLKISCTKLTQNIQIPDYINNDINLHHSDNKFILNK